MRPTSPSREPEALRDRRGGRRVRRRDDRAENERHRPREPGNDDVGDERDEHHGQQHEADRQKDDRLQVRAELAQRGEEGRAIEERRQDGDEDEIRGKLDLGDPRDEAEGEPSEHEEDRVRDPHPLGDDDQCSRRGEEDEEDEAVFGGEHRAGTARSPTASNRPSAFCGRMSRLTSWSRSVGLPALDTASAPRPESPDVARARVRRSPEADAALWRPGWRCRLPPPRRGSGRGRLAERGQDGGRRLGGYLGAPRWARATIWVVFRRWDWELRPGSMKSPEERGRGEKELARGAARRT